MGLSNGPNFLLSFLNYWETYDDLIYPIGFISKGLETSDLLNSIFYSPLWMFVGIASDTLGYG